MAQLNPRTLWVPAVTGSLVALIVVAFVSSSGASPWAYALAPLAAVLVIGFSLRKFMRRRALASQPFPPQWRSTLERRIPFYVRLDAPGRERFEFNVKVFLAEQTIYAVGETTGPSTQPVDERTRVLIAASAAMLLHGRPDLDWPTVRDIVVYPTTFNDDYDFKGGDGRIAGMVHAQGPVLLSKKDLIHGFRKPHDGHNVALHELAHVLDFGDGPADGLPAGVDFVASAPWVSVVAERLKKVRKRKYRHVLRDYAGTNEAELFAVAVEAFYERPTKLLARDPELYGMLRDYFRVDPAEMFRGPPPK